MKRLPPRTRPSSSTRPSQVPYDNRGWAYIAKGEFERAIRDLDEAIRLNPRLATAYDKRGWAYAAKGDNDRAIADLSEAVRISPRFFVAYSKRAWAYMLKNEYE